MGDPRVGGLSCEVLQRAFGWLCLVGAAGLCCLALLSHAGEPEVCCVHRENLCGASKEAIDLLDEKHPARLKLVEARERSMCE